MISKKTILVFLLCVAMTLLPVTTIADEDEPCGKDMVSPMPGWDMWGYYPGHFNYSDGKVQGSYLSFDIDESTGIVTDYTVTVSIFDDINPLMICEEEWTYDETGEAEGNEPFPEYNITFENVTVFESIKIEDFSPNGNPGTYSDLFVFQGEDILMMFYDRDWNQGFYAGGEVNNTMIFEVAQGFDISIFPDDWEDEWYFDGDEREEGEEWEEDPTYIEDDYYWPSWTEIWIESNTTMTSIMIYDGNVTIDNSTITIHLNDNGNLDINTWAEVPYFPIFDEIWYDDIQYEDEMELVEMAREEGIIAGEGWYFEAEEGKELYMGNSDYNFHDDPTFEMVFIDKGEDLIDVVVDSDIPQGRIVMINLNKEALEAESMDDIIVKLDGQEIDPTESLEELMEQVDGSEGRYFALISEEGTTVFVYVPHFSTHTITIGSILSTVSNLLVPAVLAVVLVACAALVIVFRGRKGRDDF